ncbi:MAG: Hpt domain-containing protein [Alphaproteobacteria bacterium]|nr:Hpt domain-containing protein [Alphaproteobacteria bacterium]
MDFDDSALAGLQEVLPNGEFRELLTQYLASTAARIAKVKVLRAAGDWQDLAFEAHTLVSTSGSYGLTYASAVARSLQQACKAGDVEKASILVVEVIAATTRGCAALRSRFLGESAAEAA